MVYREVIEHANSGETAIVIAATAYEIPTIAAAIVSELTGPKGSEVVVKLANGRESLTFPSGGVILIRTAHRPESLHGVSGRPFATYRALALMPAATISELQVIAATSRHTLGVIR